MESRGEHSGERPKGRLAITRRSCDQCRARKVGCDRGSPCSNCSAARLNCTHSAVASNATAPKQRVLISAQYEKKIDDIARDIDGIKVFLQGLNVTGTDAKQPQASSVQRFNQIDSAKPPVEHHLICTSSSGDSIWDHSIHIIDFVRAVVEDRGSGEDDDEVGGVFASLGRLVQTLEDPTTVKNLSFPEAKVAGYQAGPSMPPLEAVVSVLRWAKDHRSYTRIVWVSHILPLERFAEICRKVYFAIDDYSEVDLIIANGYLSYIFAEHVVVSGLQDYREYCQLCQENLRNALLRLPLVLPASMDVIAALTLGAFNAIENSKATMAWTFISTASDLSQRLGYHRIRSKEMDPSLRAAQERLFWAIYKFERGLSLRQGRPSSIRDAEITLPINANELRSTKVARIQGRVYDELYSPAGLTRPDDERSRIAEALAAELRKLINVARAEILDTNQPRSSEADPMRIVYLQCDIVCQSSLLTLILRAISTTRGSQSSISDECVKVARETLDIHLECMTAVSSCKTDPFMVRKYINWAVLHTPFVPFNILFTRTVQLSDFPDLARLDRFATSLKTESAPDSITHPFRLYELLCQAARLYIESNTSSSTSMTVANGLLDPLGEFDFTSLEMEMSSVSNEALNIGVLPTFELGDWYYDNQQMMSLLDEDMMF